MIHGDNEVNTWLLELYTSVFKRKTDGDYKVYDVIIDVPVAILNHFSTIQKAGFTPLKAAQLYRNYWNKGLADSVAEALVRDKIASMGLQNIPKKSVTNKSGTTKAEFCMKHADFKVTDSGLEVDIFYRTVDLYRGMLGDLWLFQTELNKLADDMGLGLSRVTFHCNSVQVRPRCFITTFQRDFGFKMDPAHSYPEFGYSVLLAMANHDPKLFRSTATFLRRNGVAKPTGQMKKNLRCYAIIQDLAPMHRERLLLALS